ncbi:autotransporter domain-containing protein [Luteolibacter flavescens]|uniref:Autotransporter domain-containing protein n=1 Tax=Luteolibacter flavescens TaxID=1859460 RepID=A0ABT3FMV6_9BACT|nr:autotransporter domain-containing protein [Luteolibacter flavescens]MCW1884906.1 autotransporter domain-containing protein [Luteolibacter flavescens]
MSAPEDDFEKLLAEAFASDGGELPPGEAEAATLAGDDDFERMLAEALDPGEIELSSAQRGELLAAFATAGAAPDAAEAAALEDFTAMLAGALDPGEIAFEDGQRRELIRQMTGAAAGDNLTAWALGEMPQAERERLERRMEVNASLREEALSYSRFCTRLSGALPALARPGWWERVRLRSVVFGSLARPAWAAAAAVVALLLTLMPRPQEGSGVPMATGGQGGEATPLAGIEPQPAGDGDPAPVVEDAGPMIAQVEPEVSPAVPVSPEIAEPVPAPMSLPVSDRPDMLPVVEPVAHEVEAYVFADPVLLPERSATASVSPVSPLAELPEVVGSAGLMASSTGTALSDAGLSVPFMEDGVPGEMMLAVNDSALRSFSNSDTEIGPGDSGSGSGPVVNPEHGSVTLANLQPYILPGLLGGSTSGRPKISESEGNRTISADFRLLDLELSPGNSVDAESWSASAGMTWQLSPEWQVGLSIGGIDSRLEVEGYGDVDVTGAAFGASLDWKKDGYHAALAYEVGLFDQELRRMSKGIAQAADQDATVHRLSFWFTREFEAGVWRHGPVAGFDASFGTLDSYQEAYPGGTIMGERQFTSLVTLVGWQAWGRFETPAGPVLPNFVAGWRHRPVVPDSTIGQTTVGQKFALDPQVPERDSVLLEGGLRWLPGDGAVFLDLTGSSEWRDGGESDKRLLLEVGVSF